MGNFNNFDILKNDIESDDIYFVLSQIYDEKNIYEIKEEEGFEKFKTRIALVEKQLLNMLETNGNVYPFFFFSNSEPWKYFMGNKVLVEIKDLNDLQYRAKYFSIVFDANRWTHQSVAEYLEILNLSYLRFLENKNKFDSFKEYTRLNEKIKDLNQNNLTFKDFENISLIIKNYGYSSPKNNHEIQLNDALIRSYECTSDDGIQNLCMEFDIKYILSAFEEYISCGGNTDQITFLQFLDYEFRYFYKVDIFEKKGKDICLLKTIK